MITWFREPKDKKSKHNKTNRTLIVIRKKSTIGKKRKPENGTIGKMITKKVQETKTKESDDRKEKALD
jgi:hypothetical protein